MARVGSRPSSVSTIASSLMQEVPGAFTVPVYEVPDQEGDTQEEQAHKTLAHAVHARRAEYVEAKHVRIKVGSWNVAAFKGTEKDIGAWFVGGKGVSDEVAQHAAVRDGALDRENAGSQEARFAPKQETVPVGDAGILPGDDTVGLYVLGLQEVVDLGSATEALRPYADPSVLNRWKEALGAALPVGYRVVAEQQLIGLLLLVFAAPEIADDVKCVSTTSVGTGLMGYMGNKGAVTARIVLGETTRLVFINCHLAAGADKSALERRNWDTQQILTRTRFEPIQNAMELTQNSGEQIGDEDFAFWCGDLNYRLEGIPGDDVRRLLMLHTRNAYDLNQPSRQKIEKELHTHAESSEDGENVERAMPHNEHLESSSPESSSHLSSIKTRSSLQSSRTSADVDRLDAQDDPTSLLTTLSSLLPHDELHQQMRARKAFHDGWQEGPIDFLPTYKYDPGSVAVFDSSEKKRAPSWCDRILYRTRKGKLAYETKIKEEALARKKDEDMKATGIVSAATDDDILYDYDPETDGVDEEGQTTSHAYDDYDDDEEDASHDVDTVITREGFEDELELEYYTVHQRVLSSDHKPLVAGFRLRYESIVPSLKAQVYAEVAKEWDKAENEGRPNVTVVVDQHKDVPGCADDSLDEKFEGVWFGSVRWAQSKHRTLTIANTSRVPAKFTLIERPVDETQAAGIAPKWLSLSVNHTPVSSDSSSTEPVVIEPGDSSSIELELRFVSGTDIQKNNASDGYFEDILVLRVENGRDHFIPIRGKWSETTLGRSIDKLIRIPEGGIRKLQKQKPESNSDRQKLPSASAVANVGNVQGSTEQHNDEHNPVRFSAPRELFRLTAAIEDLSAHAIAEWEMTNVAPSERDSLDSAASAPLAPWHDHPSWPFEAKCWSGHDTDEWSSALADVCDALDEDQSLLSSMSDTIPRVEKLYILCDFLMIFLENMPDGIITTDLWNNLELYMSNAEKSKRKASTDEQKTAIQEILSRSAPHNISFILITSMLERMVQEVTAASHMVDNNPKSPARKAGVALQRVATLGRASQASKRKQISESLAKTFADLVIHTRNLSSEKLQNLRSRRKAQIVQLFLDRDDAS